MIWRLAFLLALSLVAASMYAEPLEISAFTGLNTRALAQRLKPNEATIANNINFSRGGDFTLNVRKGYDSAGYRAGQDSFINLISIVNDDETRRLIVTSDSSGIGWAYNLVCSLNTNKVGSAIRLRTPVSAFGQSSAVTHLGTTYVVNGSAYGNSFPDKHPELSQPFPLQPPGSPLVTPVKEAGNVSGTVRYAMFFRKTGDDSSRVVIDGDSVYRFSPGYFGVLTRAVTVSNAKVLLSNFEMPTKQQLGTVTKDTCRIILLRTLGLRDQLRPEADSIYYIVDTLRLDSANVVDFKYIDTSSDATIIANGSFSVPAQKSLFGGTSGLTLNGFDAQNFIFYGAPTLTAAGGSFSGVTDSNGIWGGTGIHLATSAIVGYVYVCTYVDTANGNESDTGASWSILITPGSLTQIRATRKLTFQLPRPPHDGQRVRIYRAPAEAVFIDSELSRREVTEANLVKLNPSLNSIKAFSPGVYRELIAKLLKKVNTRNYFSDTVVAYRFHLLDEKEGGTEYSDSLPYDSLLRRDRLQVPFFPQEPRKIITSNNRIYMLSSDPTGDKIWTSLPDTVYAKDLFSFQNFKTLSGTRINDIWANRFGIAIKKATEGGQMYDFDTKVEPTQSHGSVSPYGHVKVEGIGDIFLSHNDVVLEGESEALDRKYGNSILSKNLNNFRQYNHTILSRAIAGYSPANEEVMFCLTDTIYTFDVRTGAWSTFTGWNFASAVTFGADSSRSGAPSDTMYFIKRGESKLYRYGFSNTDNGSAIPITYQTGGLFESPEMKMINRVGIYAASSETDSCTISIRDETQAQDESKNFALSSKRFRWFEMEPHDFQFGFLRFSSSTTLDATTITGFDIHYSLGALPVVE